MPPENGELPMSVNHHCHVAVFIPSGRVAGTGGLSHGASVYFLMAVPSSAWWMQLLSRGGLAVAEYFGCKAGVVLVNSMVSVVCCVTDVNVMKFSQIHMLTLCPLLYIWSGADVSAGLVPQAVTTGRSTFVSVGIIVRRLLR